MTDLPRDFDDYLLMCRKMFAKTMTEHYPKLECVPPSANNPPASVKAGPAEALRVLIPLRRNFSVEAWIPRDITPLEAQRIHALLEQYARTVSWWDQVKS